jgi:uncharacterized repeat protein (TIGR02543 family)
MKKRFFAVFLSAVMAFGVLFIMPSTDTLAEPVEPQTSSIAGDPFILYARVCGQVVASCSCLNTTPGTMVMETVEATALDAFLLTFGGGEYSTSYGQSTLQLRNSVGGIIVQWALDGDAPLMHRNPNEPADVVAALREFDRVVLLARLYDASTNTLIDPMAANATAHLFFPWDGRIWRTPGRINRAAGSPIIEGNMHHLRSASFTFIATQPGTYTVRAFLYQLPPGVNMPDRGVIPSNSTQLTSASLDITVVTAPTIISGGEIAAVAPTRGESVASATQTLHYGSGQSMSATSVEWTRGGTPAGTNFSGGAVYTSVATFTISEGHIFNLNANALTLQGGPASAQVTHSAVNAGRTVIVTTEWPATESDPTFAVTLANYGSNASGGGSFAAGATVNINAGTRTGYTFSGWTSVPPVTFGNANLAQTSFTMPGEAITVTANWTAVVQTHQVTITNGGTGATGAGSFVAGATVNINAGTRAGYTFNGWTSSPAVSFANPNAPRTSFTMPAQAVTLTANWTEAITDPGDDPGDYNDYEPTPPATTPPPTTPPATEPPTDPDEQEPETIIEIEVEMDEEAVLELIVGGEDLEIEAEGITVTIPNEVIAELIDQENPESIIITVNVAPSDDEDDGLLVVEIDMTIGDDPYATDELPGAVTVTVSLEDFDLENINPYRIVAVREDGTVVGGSLDVETGLFTFETEVFGEFTITYVGNLNRLAVQLNSYVISDLADNAAVQVMDMTPVIVDDRILLPIRFVSYALGAEVGWNDETRQVTLTLGGRSLTFGIGEMLPGMDVPAVLMNDRTMVPLRFISEFFGAIVEWDYETQTAQIIFVPE